MKPLSIWTYYRRRKPRAALLVTASILVTTGIYLMVALMWGLYIEPARANFLFLSRFSVVTPESDERGPDTSVIARIRAHPDVAQVIPAGTIRITLPGIIPGEDHEFDLLGLPEENVPDVLAKCGAVLKEGRLPAPRTNGLLLSEQVAASLGLQVGDTLDSSRDPDRFGSVSAPLQVAGIVESDVRLGLLPLEFVDNHESYSPLAGQFLVVARPGRESIVEAFLDSEIPTAQTYQGLNETVMNEYLDGLAILVPVIVVGALAFALVVVVANWIALSRRLPEYSIAHAIGFSRRWLIGRLTMETVTLNLIGWAIGIGLSVLALLVLRAAFFVPRGHGLPILQLIALALTLPLPVTVGGFTFINTRRTILRLDPVMIMEQGEESQERNQARQRSTSASSPKPLAATTFYERHWQRATLLIGAMTLMTLAVVFAVFVLTASFDAQRPGLQYLSRLSVVRSMGAGQGLDPGVAAQIRGHPAVERVFPMAPRYHLLSVRIPPLIIGEASPIGVYAADMDYLVELYDLELAEGHLPKPSTNEIAIPASIASNRNLQIGDVIGDPGHPAYPNAEPLPTQFVVSGILARATNPEEENWLGFVSLEFLERHEAFSVPDIPPLIVVPKPGYETILSDWLETEIAGPRVSVLTHRQEYQRFRQGARSQVLSLILLEGVIAAIAVVALAVLNYIFIAQRRPEFGLLHALGYSRRELVRRTLKESVFTTGLASTLSAILCLVGLLVIQFSVFKPLGLQLNLLNLAPWLYILPFPCAVLAVTTGTTARALARLDPVAIVERR